MAIWTKPGHEDGQMVNELIRLANGFDHEGNRVDRETQLAAINQYQQIQEVKGRRFIESIERK